MATIGALIVELRANSAQFTAEMDAARGAVVRHGEAHLLSARSMSRFASIGLEEVIPSLRGSRLAMESVITALIRLRQSAGAATGALSAVWPAIGVALAGLVGYGLGNYIQNFRDLREAGVGYVESLKLAFKGYAEFVKNATEEQIKFSDAMSRSRDVILTLEKAIDVAKGDDAGALLKTQLKRREDTLAAARKDGADLGRVQRDLNTLETLENAALLVKQRKQRDDYDENLIKAMTKQRDEQIKKWEEETGALAEQLKARVQAYQQFVAQLGTGEKGLGLGSTPGADTGMLAAYQQSMAAYQRVRQSMFQGNAGASPFAMVTAADIQAVQAVGAAWDDVQRRYQAYQDALSRRAGVAEGVKAVMDLQANIQKATNDLAFLENAGSITLRDEPQELERIRSGAIATADTIQQKFGHIPAVMDALNKATASVRFGNLNAEMERSRKFIEQNGLALDAVKTKQGEFYQQLTSKVPAGAATAGTALAKLTQQYLDLAAAIGKATGANAGFTDNADVTTTATGTPGGDTSGTVDVRVIDPTSDK